MSVQEIGMLTVLGALIVLPVVAALVYGACELVLYMRREWRKR